MGKARVEKVIDFVSRKEYPVARPLLDHKVSEGRKMRYSCLVKGSVSSRGHRMGFG